MLWVGASTELRDGLDAKQIRVRIKVGDETTLLSAPGLHLLGGHVGKGQQLDWVVVIGAEDGVIPDFRATTPDTRLERKAKDEERLRQKWGRLGGIAVALSDDRQSTEAWATGAVGEERLGARLDSLVSQSIAVLHDRHIPGTRATIDHIAITTAGIWVVNAKRYKGRPEL